MSLPENVGTGWVTGTFLAGDLAGTPVAGSITFTPSAKSVKDITADPPATLFPQPVTVALTEGTFLVELLATNDDDLNPNGWTYDVSFGLTISNKPTPFAAFPIAVPEGPEGSPVDLAVVAPLAASGGTVIIRGVGLPDVAGASAGQVVGFDGTTTAWIDQTGEGGVGTQGPKGDKGDQGDPGTPGADGADGSDGAPGADGADGKSAYEVAVDEGFVGNEAAWLVSLVGPEGPAGETGPKGDQGNPGTPGTDGADGADYAGPTITVSATAPTSPSLNDIWVDLS